VLPLIPVKGIYDGGNSGICPQVGKDVVGDELGIPFYFYESCPPLKRKGETLANCRAEK